MDIPNRVRILLVNNSADLYGASRSLLRLVCRLKEHGLEPAVLLPCEGPLADLLRNTAIKVLIDPSLRVITRPVLASWRLVPWLTGFLPSAFGLARLIKHEKIDIVHTNTGVIVSSGLAARIARCPHVWHIRDWFQEFGPLWKPYSRYILSHAARIFCVSKAIAEQFPDSEKIEVLNNGFDLGEFPEISAEERAAARAQWGIAADEFVVGSVGRIKFKRKGQEFLLRAAGILRDRGINICCLVAGGPPPGAERQLEEMRKLSEELGVRAVFTGELANAREAYASMDVLALPSAQPEPFGGVVMEAMALGLPVVGTKIGGTVDQIADNETGFLVPPGDPSAMAAGIERLALNEEQRKLMGTAGRRRVADKFGIRAMSQRIISAYDSLTVKKAPVATQR